MSKYTTEVRYICEEYAGLSESSEYSGMNDVIAKSRGKVFDFDFPMFDEKYRTVLETKILKHYYTREIGMETVSAWKRFMDMRMNEIMPYYNQLYKSASLEFNPFYDVDLSTSGNRKNNGSETNTSNNVTTNDLHDTSKTENLRTDNTHTSTNGNSTRTDDLANTNHTSGAENVKQRYSDTPQGYLGNIEDNTYLTNATITDTTNTTDSNGTDTGTVKNVLEENVDNTGTVKYNIDSNISNTGTVKNNGNTDKGYNSTDEYIEHVVGKRGGESYSELLKQYRQTFLNIDMMVIEELGDLFMNLW